MDEYVSGSESDAQTGWSFCGKCKGLYYGPEQSTSVCPAKGTHGGNSATYVLWYDDATITWSLAQLGWSFCDRCKILYFSKEQSSSVCPAPGAAGTHGGSSRGYYMFYTVNVEP